MKRIKVAVGIVYDGQSRVLVGQRVVKDLYFEKWEFPGGKIENSEQVADALAREFQEEIGIEVLSSEPLMELEHDYPDRKVKLFICLINSYRGEVRALEGQALRWVRLEQLDEMDFLQGNQPIITALQQRARSSGST